MPEIEPDKLRLPSGEFTIHFEQAKRAKRAALPRGAQDEIHLVFADQRMPVGKFLECIGAAVKKGEMRLEEGEKLIGRVEAQVMAVNRLIESTDEDSSDESVGSSSSLSQFPNLEAEIKRVRDTIKAFEREKVEEIKTALSMIAHPEGRSSPLMQIANVAGEEDISVLAFIDAIDDLDDFHHLQLNYLIEEHPTSKTVQALYLLGKKRTDLAPFFELQRELEKEELSVKAQISQVKIDLDRRMIEKLYTVQIFPSKDEGAPVNLHYIDSQPLDGSTPSISFQDLKVTGLYTSNEEGSALVDEKVSKTVQMLMNGKGKVLESIKGRLCLAIVNAQIKSQSVSNDQLLPGDVMRCMTDPVKVVNQQGRAIEIEGDKLSLIDQKAGKFERGRQLLTFAAKLQEKEFDRMAEFIEAYQGLTLTKEEEEKFIRKFLDEFQGTKTAICLTGYSQGISNNIRQVSLIIPALESQNITLKSTEVFTHSFRIGADGTIFLQVDLQMHVVDNEVFVAFVPSKITEDFTAHIRGPLYDENGPIDPEYSLDFTGLIPMVRSVGGQPATKGEYVASALKQYFPPDHTEKVETLLQERARQIIDALKTSFEGDVQEGIIRIVSHLHDMKALGYVERSDKVIDWENENDLNTFMQAHPESKTVKVLQLLGNKRLGLQPLLDFQVELGDKGLSNKITGEKMFYEADLKTFCKQYTLEITSQESPKDLLIVTYTVFQPLDEPSPTSQFSGWKLKGSEEMEDSLLLNQLLEGNGDHSEAIQNFIAELNEGPDNDIN